MMAEIVMRFNDMFFVCDTCNIKTRIPTSADIKEFYKGCPNKLLPNIYQVIDQHQVKGHECRVVTGPFTQWPPSLDETANFRVALDETGAESEQDYYV